MRFRSPTWSRVGNFRQKNNSAEDGIDGTNGYFRRNSGCSAEQNFSEFRSEPFRGTEIEANSWNSLPNPSTEEKITRNSVPRNRNRSKLSEFPSEPFSGRENNSEFRSEPFRRRENNLEQNAAVAVSDSTQTESSCRDRKNWFPPPWLKDIFSNLDCSVKLHFFAEFPSVPFRASELALPRNSE
jgi:hypothetical protein